MFFQLKKKFNLHNFSKMQKISVMLKKLLRKKNGGHRAFLQVILV